VRAFLKTDIRPSRKRETNKEEGQLSRLYVSDTQNKLKYYT